MEQYFLFQDNLAVVTDLEEMNLQAFLDGKYTLPQDEDDMLGDAVLFKMVSDGKLSNWMIGRFCAIDLMTEPLTFTNMKHVYYHHFPTVSYLYIQTEAKLQDLGTTLDKLQADDSDWDFIYPPIISFPEDLPSSLNQEIPLDVWFATNAEAEDQEDYVKKAKPYRSYSYNYVKSLLDFNNLPDYQE